MKFQITTFISFSLSILPLVSAQGFAATCWDISIGDCDEFAWFLDATCATETENVAFGNSLNLNDCLANINSNWALQVNGNFGYSAGNCYLQGTVLYCNPIPYGVDLNSFVANRNGFLECLGFYGGCLDITTCTCAT